MKPLIFDVFPYNGDEILPFRLEYLYDYVDYFILLEAKESFTGAPKPYYHIDRHLPSVWKYIDKLIIVKLDSFPPRPSWFNISSNNNPDDWWREWAQREQSKSYIQALAKGQPFVVMSGDVDEFPSRQLIANPFELYDRVGVDPLYLNMEFFYYNFNWRKANKWDQYYLKSDKGFVDHFMSDWKIHRQGPIIDCGWHFSYFMSKENIATKVSSIGHTEFNRPEFKAADHVSDCIRTGKDLFLRPGEECFPYVDQGHLPADWQKFQSVLEVIQ